MTDILPSNKSDSGPDLLILLKDAERFVLRFGPTMQDIPLQIYGAPLALCPTKTMIKQYFWKDRLSCIKEMHGVVDFWDPCLQVLERAHDEDDMDTHDASYPMLRIAFSPSGRTIAGAWNLNLRLWDTVTGMVKDFEASDPYPAFSADSKTLINLSRNGLVEFWDISTNTPSDSPQITGKLWNDFSSTFAHIAISPDGSTVTRESKHGTLTIWDLKTMTMKETPQTDGGRITALAYTADGKQVASASKSGTLQFWDTGAAVCSRRFENPGVNTSAMCCSVDGRWLASASSNGLALWNIKSGECKILNENHQGGKTIAFSPSGSMIASDFGPFLKLFHVSDGKCVTMLKGHIDEITALAFSPDGTLLASSSEDCRGRIWDIPAVNGEHPTDAPEEEAHGITCIDISSDGSLLALGVDDCVQLCDMRSGVCLNTIQLGGEVYSVAFSPDGNVMAANIYHSVEIWSIATPVERRHQIDWPWAKEFAFSPDSKLLASAFRSRTDSNIGAPKTKVLDITTGDWVRELDALGGGAIAFSSDARFLASSSYILELETGVKRKLGYATCADLLWFSKDDRLILTEDESFDLESWELELRSTSLQKYPAHAAQLHVEGEWIMKDGQKLIWLPSEYKLQHWRATSHGVHFVSGIPGQMYTSFEFV